MQKSQFLSTIVPPISISPTSAAKAVEVGYAPNWVQELIHSVPMGFITDPSEVRGYTNIEEYINATV